MGPFVRDKLWFWLVLVVMLSTTCGVRAERYRPAEEGAPQAVAEAEQVVVLQDGGVLVGRVTRSGERYVVARGTGEAIIPTSKVMLIAASLADAYQQRRQRLVQPTADNHLVLAEWCLRQTLFEHAEAELAEARSLEPRHDKLRLFESRLALAKEHEQKKAEVVARAATDSPAAATPSPPGPTSAGDLPPGTLERFTRKVQPVLVNSCTTSGCHELGGTTKFQLDRALLRGMSNQRSTMSNLTATLTLVDREQPQQSPLLTIPRRTHGGMKAPVFGPRREAAFRHLYEWVALVTAKTAKPMAAASPAESVETVAVEGETLSHWQSPVKRSERQATDGSLPALYQERIGESDAHRSEGELADAASATNAKSPLRYGTRLQHWQPRDQFDPEIFNRKYGAPEPNVVPEGAE